VRVMHWTGGAWKSDGTLAGLVDGKQ
jgi:hypothetical protein